MDFLFWSLDKWLFELGCIGDLADQVIVGLYQNEACFCTTVVLASFCGHAAKVSILCMSSLFSGRTFRGRDV